MFDPLLSEFARNFRICRTSSDFAFAAISAFPMRHTLCFLHFLVSSTASARSALSARFVSCNANELLITRFSQRLLSWVVVLVVVRAAVQNQYAPHTTHDIFPALPTFSSSPCEDGAGITRYTYPAHCAAYKAGAPHCRLNIG